MVICLIMHIKIVKKHYWEFYSSCSICILCVRLYRGKMWTQRSSFSFPGGLENLFALKQIYQVTKILCLGVGMRNREGIGRERIFIMCQTLVVLKKKNSMPLFSPLSMTSQCTLLSGFSRSIWAQLETNPYPDSLV